MQGLILQGYRYVTFGRLFGHIGLNVTSIVMLFHGFRSTAKRDLTLAHIRI